MSVYSEDIKTRIRTVADWPVPGVKFRDITPLLGDHCTFRKLIDSFVHHYQPIELDAVAAIDARGFLVGAPLAYELGLKLVPVRKQGKLPYTTESQHYELEYGAAEVEMHIDAVKPGDKVLLVDDLIATGGTMLAACQLVQRLGGEIVEIAAIVDLPELGGSLKLRDEGYRVSPLCSFHDSE